MEDKPNSAVAGVPHEWLVTICPDAISRNGSSVCERAKQKIYFEVGAGCLHNYQECKYRGKK